MSKSTTSVTYDRENSAVNKASYRVALLGTYQPRLKAHRVMDSTNGAKTVTVTSPLTDAGKPAYAVATLDAVSRKIDPSARISQSATGAHLHIRTYTVTK